MSLLVNIPGRNLDRLIEKLSEYIPSDEIVVWPNVEKPEEIDFALVWKHQHGSLQAFNNLKAISSFGAGVDSILSDPLLPDVPICRIKDPQLAKDMAEYVLTLIQHHKLRLAQFNQQQLNQVWKPKSKRKGNTVGILGLGQLGQATATLLNQFGFNILGWSQSEKQLAGVVSYTGQKGLERVAKQADYLVCLLPLTPKTKGILNKSIFDKMPNDAALINVARGEHLNEDDLLYALEQRELNFAYLDVFQQEPLAKSHPFWQNQHIMITPHISAVTNVDTAVSQIVKNYKNLSSQSDLINVIDIQSGY